MSALARRLRNLTAAVERTGKPQAVTLERGLRVAARMVADEIDGGPSFLQVSLTRDKVTPPSAGEAAVVVRCLGWGPQAWTQADTTRKGLPCLLICDGRPMLGGS